MPSLIDSGMPCGVPLVSVTIPNCSVGSTVIVVAAPVRKAPEWSSRAAVAVVRDVPAEPVELRPFTGRRRLEQLVVRHVGNLERSALDDLRAVDGAVGELQPDELQHVVDGRAESAGRRLGVRVSRVPRFPHLVRRRADPHVERRPVLPRHVVVVAVAGTRHAQRFEQNAVGEVFPRHLRGGGRRQAAQG